jgi:hypothetical protein
MRDHEAIAEANSKMHRQECPSKLRASLCYKIKHGGASEDGSRYAESA